MTVDVTAVNDVPTSSGSSVTATEDAVFIFAIANFPFSDDDPTDNLVNETAPATKGTLWVDMTTAVPWIASLPSPSTR